MKPILEYIKENSDNTKIGNILVSNDIFKECFECNLEKCKGACCTQGGCGAELKDNEIKILDDVYNEVKDYLDEESIRIIEESGTSKKYADFIGTQLKKDSSCVFSINQNGKTLCAIDKAYREGNKFLKENDFCKPISCHLYPIQKDGNKLTYSVDERCIYKKCKDPVCITQKDPLIRLFGESWYKEIENKMNKK